MPVNDKKLDHDEKTEEENDDEKEEENALLLRDDEDDDDAAPNAALGQEKNKISANFRLYILYATVRSHLGHVPVANQA